MTNTGFYLDEKEIENVKMAANQPYIMVGGTVPESAQEMVHRYALAKGLPEYAGYYGADLTTGEILSS